MKDAEENSSERGGVGRHDATSSPLSSGLPSSAFSSPLLVLAGPTGVGKSDLALSVARRCHGAIVSADSMQVYRGFRIGTAQPSEAERCAVPHRLVGHVDPRERYDAARFVAEAEAAIAETRAAGRLPFVVGGTGLYLQSLIEGLFEGPSRDGAVRDRLDREAEVQGVESLHRRLGAVDPEAAARIMPRDKVRIVRALEVFEVTGRPISAWQAEGRRRGRRHAARYVVATREREELNARIDARVRRMLEAGWVVEVRALVESGVPEDAPGFRALGYREVLAHLRGEIDAAAMEAEIAKVSRQYAKRQITWFRAVAGAAWISLTGLNEADALAQVERAWGLERT